MTGRTDLVRGYKEAYRNANDERKGKQHEMTQYYKNDELKKALASIRPLRGWLTVDQQEWEVRARNVLDDDLRRFDDSGGFDYDLDQPTRDRLLAHSRQDVAMLYYALVKVEREARTARVWSWVCVLVLLIVLYKVW
jgi:hypothetical protein